MTDTHETVGAIPCPRPGCDRPLNDTAYVCSRCAAILAVSLRNAAANWPEVEAAVARQTAIAADGSPPHAPRVLHGPTDIPCEHDSCLRVRQSQLRSQWTETPISGEKNLVSLGSLEDAWIITNTATTWARFVQDATHDPIPFYAEAEPDRAEARRGFVSNVTLIREPVPTREPLCDRSWLPMTQCAHCRKEAS